MQKGPLLSLSPSFNSYSSGKLALIAARVVEEFRAESDQSDFDGAFDFSFEENSSERNEQQKHVEEANNFEEGDENDDDDDFEFAVVGRDAASSPISADEVFYNGQIRPMYPVFNRNLYFGGFEDGNDRSSSEKPPMPPPHRLPLRKLMSEDRDPPSCSSSEADELDGLPAEMYCMWKPKTGEDTSPGNCKKSSSTGSSSKRWKFRDFLHRSNSEGKDTFVFLSPSHNTAKPKDEKAEKRTDKDSAEVLNVSAGKRSTKVAAAGNTAAHEEHYVRNKVTKEGDRRRSFLPYRQDLVGFFANVNGLNRNLHPS